MISGGRLWYSAGAGLALWPLSVLVSCIPAGTSGIQGVDVSHHQAPMDWAALRRSGIRFAYLKASEGSDWTDPKYREYEEAARAQGILVGAYHYFTFCADPERQAMHFLATVDLRPGDLMPAVDIENQGNCLSNPDPETLRANLRRFRAMVVRATGREPILYMTEWFYRMHYRADPGEGRLWLRNLFWHPLDGAPWAIWQYAADRPPGAQGDIDRNVLRGGEAALAGLRHAPGN